MTRSSSRKAPAHCYYDKDKGWYYKAYLGVVDGKPQRGRREYLGFKERRTPFAVLAAAIEDKLKPRTTKFTLRWLLESYMSHPEYELKLSYRTRQDRAAYFEYLEDILTADGISFLDVHLDQLDQIVMKNFLISYKGRRGQWAPQQANHIFVFISAAWSHQRQYMTFTSGSPDGGNPCAGVKKNVMKPRDRYVDHGEYDRGIELMSGWFRIAAELAMICRARRGELLNRTYRDWDEGIGALLIERAKKSNNERTVHDRITELIDESRALPGYVDKDSYILRNQWGRKVGISAWNSALRRHQQKMRELEWDSFTMHDLKAKGISDRKGGDDSHKTEKARAVYERKARITRPEYE